MLSLFVVGITNSVVKFDLVEQLYVTVRVRRQWGRSGRMIAWHGNLIY